MCSQTTRTRRKSVLAKFDEYCELHKNYIYNSFKFHSLSQGSDKIDTYVTKLGTRRRSSTLRHEDARVKTKGRNSHKPSRTERKATESKQGIQFLWWRTRSEERRLLCIWQEMQQLRSAEPLCQEVPQASSESSPPERLPK